jgi:hypothetical protein
VTVPISACLPRIPKVLVRRLESGERYPLLERVAGIHIYVCHCITVAEP